MRTFAPLLWLAASLLFHFPLSPLWKLGRARATPRLERVPPPALLAEIPVDTTDQPPGEAQAAPPPAPEPVAEPTPAEPTAVEPEASLPALPTAVPTPRKPEREKEPLPVVHAGVRGSDPLAALGSVRSVNNTVANVRLQIENDRLREHPLGARVAALLAEVNGWRDLLQPGGLDLARVLIAAPSVDSSVGTVAIIEHHANSEAAGALIDRARVDAQGLPRHLIQPSPAVVVVALQRYLPASSYSDPELGLRPLDEGVVAFAQLEKPWRAARVLGLTIPRSIRWLRGRVELTATGVRIEIEAEDENADLARRDAEALTRVVNAESVVFEASEASIHGKISLTEAQGLAWLEGLRGELTRSLAPAASATAETASPGGADPAPDAEKPPSVLGRPAIATDPP